MNRASASRHHGKITTAAIGVVLLIVTTLASLGVVIHNVISLDHPDHTVVTLCHWQLEAGYRDALQAVINDYEAMHPGVEIQQLPITEKVYTQWLNTQLISRTAPDMIEVGKSNLSSKDEYVVRFFDSIGDEVVKPNPYNKGTKLDGVPWKETFIDGMRGGFKDSLQDYFMVPTTATSTRLYCNMNLIREASGYTAPPKTFGELIDICQKVRTYSLAHGGAINPMISAYGSPQIIDRYLVPFTASFESALDLDLDGSISVPETYYGLMDGKVSLDSPAIRAYWEAAKVLCDQMPRGFTSIDRQQAQFQFVNGNVAFFATGSWDASGTFLAVKPKGIEIKLIQWPLPGKGEPYSQYITGRQNEAAGRGQGQYGIFKYSRNKAVALDFLRYLSSVPGNEKLNRESEWPPLVIGAEPSEIMKPFMPDPVGFTSLVTLKLGSKLTSVVESQSDLYLQGEPGNTLDHFLSTYDKALRNPRTGDYSVWYEYDQRWRDCRNQETVLDHDAMADLMAPGEYSPKHFQRTMLQQLRRNNGRDYQYQFQTNVGRPMPEF